VGEATPRDVATILGAEAEYVQRRPVQVFDEWTDDFVWIDATGRFEIVFGRMRHADAPFSMFRFSGRFPTKAAGLDAIAAWLALVDAPNVATRMNELRASAESYVEYESQIDGEAIRLSLGISSIGDEWSAGLDVENIGAPAPHPTASY
jgi:hypothetical protein